MPVIGDHCGMVEAAHSINEPYFRALLRLVGEDTFACRFQRRSAVSKQFTRPGAAQTLVRANPERLNGGTDWPHPSIHAEVMPDGGRLLDLFGLDVIQRRRRILVDTSVRLFGI